MSKYLPGQLLNGHLFISDLPSNRTNNRRQGVFKCGLCNTEFVGDVSHLARGKIASCGCTRHGHTNNKGYRSPTYTTYTAMMRRVVSNDPVKAKYYKNKGIIVCDRWKDFKNFLADMGERPKGATLDRIDGNGNYEPSNCKWATGKEQSRNLSNSLVITYKGKSKNINEWVEELGLRYSRLRNRIFLDKIPPYLAFTEEKKSREINRFLKMKRNNQDAVRHSFGV